MSRTIVSFAVASLLVAASGPSSLAADPVKERLENSPRHHEWVEVATLAGRTVKCWVVFPEVDKPVPAVIIIHENRGLNDWARGLADQVAQAGYVAVAPDLLSGTGPDGGGTASFDSSDAARKGIYELSPDQVTADLDAVVDCARNIPAANKTVAVCGFCWGGSQTFRYATHNGDIAAAFVFYGGAPRDEAAYTKIEVPVYGFYGGNDNRITGRVPAVAKKMKELGKTYEPVTYEGAGHGFMRSGEAPDASDANKQGREDAWTRWKELLSKL